MHDRTAACWERSLILLGGLLTQDSVNMGRLEEYEVMKVCQPSRSSMQDAHIRTHVPTACWCPLQLLGIMHGDNRTIDFLQLLQFLQTNCAFWGDTISWAPRFLVVKVRSSVSRTKNFWTWSRHCLSRRYSQYNLGWHFWKLKAQSSNVSFHLRVFIKE